MTLQGKGFFIWTIRNCENGDPDAIASVAAQAGLSHVVIKIADGVSDYNINQTTGADLVPPLVQSLRRVGVQPWGWHYVYGYNPTGEADKAIERTLELGMDTYVIDAEAEYKQPGKDEAATTFMDRLRSGLPNTPLILCSYRYPTYHPAFPWKQFLEKCDYNMPQVYWLQAHNPGEQLIRCVREFQAITPFRPMFATGSAWKDGDWAPPPAEVVEFLSTAQELSLGAANFWSWSHCRRDLPETWQAIADYPWTSAPPQQDIVQRYIAALNAHDTNQVLALYDPQAVHVTPARTLQGQAALRGWYNALFTQILPNAAFTLGGFEGTGSNRSLSWTATSSRGAVLDGRDTLGLLNDKIVYHYTQFSAP